MTHSLESPLVVREPGRHASDLGLQVDPSGVTGTGATATSVASPPAYAVHADSHPYAVKHSSTPDQQPVSVAAITSVLFGILGMIGGFCLLGIPCFIAVVFGHVALAEIKKGVKSGRRIAISGLAMGYLFVFPAIVLALAGGVGNIVDYLRAH